MTIAVTAATGKLGGGVLDELLTTQPAEELVAVVRNPARAGHLRDRGVTVRTADYDDRGSYIDALTGVGRLLLISGVDFGRRVEQHTNVIEAAKQAGVSFIGYTSAPHADTSTLSVAAEHRGTEEALTASGITHAALRNNWYTEMFASSIALAEETGAVWSNAPTGRVASASRNDYAVAAARVLVAPGRESRVYELTGDHAWTYDELAAAVSELLGKSIVHRSVSAEEHRKVLLDAGAPEPVAHFAAELDEMIEKGHLAQTTGELQALIGRPSTPLLEGLRASVAPA